MLRIPSMRVSLAWALSVVKEAATYVPFARLHSGNVHPALSLSRDKTKWAFSCRPTLLTMGMVATQRTEGMFGVAKRSGVHKILSLCGLWDQLQLLYHKMDIEHSR